MSGDGPIQERVFRQGGIRWRRYYGEADASGSDAGGISPLVILHGLFGSGDNWQSQARSLSGRGNASRTVLVPDLPNHGDSFHTDSFTYPDQARVLWDALPGVLERCDLSPDTDLELLGHSMGGKIVMAMTLERPHRVSRLVVVDILPRVYAPRHEAILRGMRAVTEGAPPNRKAAERILERWIPEKAVRLFLLKSLAPDPESGPYRWKLNLEGITRCYDAISDWPYREGRYDGPVLFVRGALSPYIGDAPEGEIHRFFPRAVVTTVSDAGHWVHAEQRDAFLSVVREDET